MLHVSFFDNGDESYIREWLSHVSDRCLFSFAMGIRAVVLATGRKPDIPATVAKWVVRELVSRKSRDYKNLLASKMNVQ